MSALFHEKKSATADRIMACIPIEVSSLCEKFSHVAFFFFTPHNTMWMERWLRSHCHLFKIRVNCFSRCPNSMLSLE
jgi:hypothetical protein